MIEIMRPERAPHVPEPPSIEPSVDTETIVIMRREVIIHEHYARMADGTLVPILPPGARPAFTAQQMQQPRVQALSESLITPLIAPAPMAATGETSIVPRTRTAPLALAGPVALPKKRKHQHRAIGNCLLLLVTGMIMSFVYGTWPTSKAVPTATAFATTGSLAPLGVVQGPNSLSADQINAILATYHSPAAGSGQAFFDLGAKYGIDDAYAVAFFVHESTAGTNTDWAGLKADGSTTHNVGNIICAGYSACYGRFRDYSTWDAGIEDWYHLIAVEYMQGRGTTTVAQIVPVYAPSSDNNVPSAYIASVTGLVANWRTTYALSAAVPESFVALVQHEQRADDAVIVGTLQNTGAGVLTFAWKDITVTAATGTFAALGHGSVTVAPGQTTPIELHVPAGARAPYQLHFQRSSGVVTFAVPE